tara:strand:+ start:2057 stop:2656 length:600 start_codon:yes stop_codon:yes gene_type:complete
MIEKILYPQGFRYKFNKDLVTELEPEQGIKEIVKHFKPGSILELGSWLGKSAVSFGKESLANNIDAKILCVDTWLGSHEYWTTYIERQKLVAESFDIFCSNIVYNGLESNVLPFRQTTKNAINIFKHYNFKFDLVYWDSDHSSVLQDLLMCEDILQDHGIVVVDDYFQHELVKQQVDSYLLDKETKKESIDDKIIIRKY